MTPLSCENIRQFIILWDNLFPWDFWYRKKYNIKFGSREHLETSLIYSAVEYVEYCEVEKTKKKEREQTVDGDFQLQDIIKPTKEEIDEDFEKLDFSNLYGDK